MAHKYVLNYFPLSGRAEHSRLMFHLAGVEFEDNQIPMQEWPQHKSDAKKFPLGQMPTLEVDGEVICHGKAISSFLAEEFNLYGASNWDRAFLNQVVETIAELSEGFVKIKFDKEKDEDTKKTELAAYFAGDRVKVLFGFISSKLKCKPGKFFLGDKVTFADLVYFVAHEYLDVCYPTIKDDYPELAALYKYVAEVEPIKKYLANRKHKHFF